MSGLLVVTLGEVADATVRIAGIALLSGVVGVLTAFLFRAYTREPIPDGVAVLMGVSVVAVVLNTQSALQSEIGGRTDLLDPATAVFTILAFLAGGILADAGRRTGDRVGERSTPALALRDLGEMGQIVRAAGRVVTVQLPDDPGDLEDIEGYDPVPPETRAEIAGRTFTFPRGLTVTELRDRLVERLREDHGVGHVDVELGVDGTVEYLALGSRAAGIGTTLGPGTAAVAVRADPPYSASVGDVVQVWQTDPALERVARAEFRGASGEVVTLALDEADARTLDPAAEYRLVTLPSEGDAEREFASLLRAADETMSAVTVGDRSQVVGETVGDLEVTVVAVRSDEGIEAIPTRSRTIATGDVVYVVARPEDLREFEAATGGESGSPTPEESPEATDD